MTADEILAYIETHSITVGPRLDDAWKLLGWYATDTDGHWGTGKNPREAVVNLKSAMEVE